MRKDQPVKKWFPIQTIRAATRCLAIAALMMVPAVAHASDQDGSVYWYAADINTVSYAFIVSGTRTTKPACATDDAWAITTPTTDGGKAMLAGIITAKAGNRAVQVRGSGLCDPSSPTREKVQYILFF